MAKETNILLMVIPSTSLWKIKIRNFLLSLVFGIHSVFGLLCWQKQNISFTYWSIYFGKNVAQICILRIFFRDTVSSGDALHNCCYCYWKLHMCLEGRVWPLRQKEIKNVIKVMLIIHNYKKMKLWQIKRAFIYSQT